MFGLLYEPLLRGAPEVTAVSGHGAAAPQRSVPGEEEEGGGGWVGTGAGPEPGPVGTGQVSSTRHGGKSCFFSRELSREVELDAL